jgi:hypothetical protein
MAPGGVVPAAPGEPGDWEKTTGIETKREKDNNNRSFSKTRLVFEKTLEKTFGPIPAILLPGVY